MRNGGLDWWKEAKLALKAAGETEAAGQLRAMLIGEEAAYKSTVGKLGRASGSAMKGGFIGFIVKKLELELGLGH